MDNFWEINFPIETSPVWISGPWGIDDPFSGQSIKFDRCMEYILKKLSTDGDLWISIVVVWEEGRGGGGKIFGEIVLLFHFQSNSWFRFRCFIDFCFWWNFWLSNKFVLCEYILIFSHRIDFFQFFERKLIFWYFQHRKYFLLRRSTFRFLFLDSIHFKIDISDFFFTTEIRFFDICPKNGVFIYLKKKFFHFSPTIDLLIFFFKK